MKPCLPFSCASSVTFLSLSFAKLVSEGLDIVEGYGLPVLQQPIGWVWAWHLPNGDVKLYSLFSVVYYWTL